MTLFEILIKCPHCDSAIRLIVQEASPIILSCEGCGKGIVVHGDKLFNVDSLFIKKLLKKHKTVPCGQLLNVDISEAAKSMLTDSKIKELQEVLKENTDVSDFIKKM
jgi:hypothetical protein